MNPIAERHVPLPQINMTDVITLVARLAQLLAEEADLLAAMKVSKIEALQQEKLLLVSALETQRKLLDKHPDMLESISAEDRTDLRAVMEVFNAVLEENYRRLLMAKEVNHRIVGAITEVVTESARSGIYNERGEPGDADAKALSLTLNKKI